MKKIIMMGVMAGMLTMTGVSAGAMGIKPVGYLTTANPLYSAPKGFAKTVGPSRTITAKCVVKKSGYSKKSVYASKNNGGTVETKWVYGPTYVSKGTIFHSVHTGYGVNGTYWTGDATRKF